jgi:hypothetical protein
MSHGKAWSKTFTSPSTKKSPAKAHTNGFSAFGVGAEFAHAVGFFSGNISSIFDFLVKGQSTPVESTGAEKNKLFPTSVAYLLNDFLVKYFSEIVDYQFTAKLESDFDTIGNITSVLYGRDHRGKS